MPQLDREQRKIVRLIKAEGRHIANPGIRKRYLRAAVQTGLVESHLHNLSGGDADSAGWRQERASLYKDPTNLRASIRRFREEFQQQYDPGESSYEVAAQVQRPAAQYRGRYKDVRGEAAQILGQTPGASGGGGGGSAGSGAQYGTLPGVDNSAARQQALVSYLGDRGRPGALLNLKLTLDAARDTPSRRVQTRGSRPGSQQHGGGGTYSPGKHPGTANFEGKTVAAWIKPALVYARKHGWKGVVNSGYRSFEEQTRIYNSGVRPAAKPGTSNHEGDMFPRGAVDVSDAQQLAQILHGTRFGKKLQWAGAKDPVHFSHPHGGSY